jgi:hypothetical protein
MCTLRIIEHGDHVEEPMKCAVVSGDGAINAILY